MPGAEPVLWCWVYRRGSAELSALQEVSCIDNIEDVIDSTTVQHVIADLSALHEISYIDNIEDVIDSKLSDTLLLSSLLFKRYPA